MELEIQELFNIFDENGDGKLEAGEIFRTLQSFGIEKTMQECKTLISENSGGGDFVGREKFSDMI